MEKEELKKLKVKLEKFLEVAPSEEECSNEENEVYADMQNLKESICNYLCI